MSYHGATYLHDDLEFEDEKYEEDERENDEPQEESDEGIRN